MEVILLKSIKKLGNKYDLIKVKDGYASNYLIPHKLAVPANEHNTKHYMNIKKIHDKKITNKEQITQELIDACKKIGKIILQAKGTKEGKLYAGIKESDIIRHIKEKYGIELVENFIKMEEHIKTAGEHTVKLDLGEEVINLALLIEV